MQVERSDFGEPLLGLTIQVFDLGSPREIPTRCSTCRSKDITMWVAWTPDTTVSWLIGQPAHVQSSYLGLRDNGMDDPTAREMAVVAHTPPPTD